MGSPLLGICRLLAYLTWTVLAIPVQAIGLWLKLPWRETMPRFYHRTCARLLGFDIVVRGEVSTERPTLFVSNHTSYLDIIVLGSLIRGSFVAKREVGNWPFFGQLARLQRTVFVDRRVGSTDAQRHSLEGRLRAGENLVLFPEGTSSDGTRALPFRSALFEVAKLQVNGKPVTVQPVSVCCTALDGIPLGRRLRGVYAWYGDLDLLPHIWTVAGLGRLTVLVEFHAPVTIEALGSRKALAEACWRAVAEGVACANSGRWPTTVVTA